MAIDLSKFILSANNSGGQRLTPSEQLGLAYKQQNQFAESSTRAYQQAMAQGSAAAIPLAFAMGLERRRANEALGRYNQAQVREDEQLLESLPEDMRASIGGLPRKTRNEVIQKAYLSQFEKPKPIYKQLANGTYADFSSGVAVPVLMKDGSIAQGPTKKGDITNVYAGGPDVSEFDKKMAAQDAALIPKLDEKANLADDELLLLGKVKGAVLNPQTSQGVFGDIRSNFKKVQDYLGFNPKGMEDEAIIKSVGFRLALRLRNPKGVDGGMPGAVAVKEMMKLIEANPNLNYTQAQNLALIELAEIRARRNGELNALKAEYIRENKTSRGWSKYKKQWLEKNPLLTPEQDAQIAAPFQEAIQANRITKIPKTAKQRQKEKAINSITKNFDGGRTIEIDYEDLDLME